MLPSVRSGWDAGSGSVSNTSIAAPAICLFLKAPIKAWSSTIGPREVLISRAVGLGGLRRHVLTPGDQVHAKVTADSGHRRSYPPKSQDAEGFPLEVHTHGCLPAAGSNRVALRHDIARRSQDKGPCKFDGWGRPVSGMGNRDPAFCCCSDVDRRIYGPRRADELEIGEALDDAARER